MKHERSLGDTAPPIGGLSRQLSNPTPLSQNAGKINLICPICTTHFRRHAAWAKRVNVNYCSKACSNKGKEFKIETQCLVCAQTMLLPPALSRKKLTCGPVCSSVRKRHADPALTRNGSTAAYRAARNALLAGTIECAECRRAHGPWIVRGITIAISQAALPSADAASARVVCQDCHLNNIAASGGKARHID